MRYKLAVKSQILKPTDSMELLLSLPMNIVYQTANEF